MEQIDLFNQRFDGSDIVQELDQKRLTGQILRVYNYMSDGRWRTLDELSSATVAPHASVSAQLRNLRKERFGGLGIDKRRRGEPSDGLWEYKLIL